MGWIEQNEGLVILLLLVIGLRIPALFEPYWYGDEGIYLTVGQAMRQGSGLYTQIVDHKTPMIYWLAELAGNLVGLKLILITASVMSTGLFYLLAEKLFKKTWAINISSLAFVLLTTLPSFEGHIANGELILMPFVLAGMYGFWQYWPQKITQPQELHKILSKLPTWSPYFIGSMFGLAILTKVPAGFDLLGLGVFLGLMMPYSWDKINRATYTLFGLKIILGTALPIGLSVIYFALRGGLYDYLQFGLLYNFWYISAWGSPFNNAVAVFLSSLNGRLLILVILTYWFWRQRKNLGLGFLFTVIWFIYALFGAYLSLRPYPHYLIQIMPAAALLVGFLIEGSRQKRWLSALMIAITAATIYWLRFAPFPTMAYYRIFSHYLSGKITQEQYFASFDASVPGNYALAKWIVEHTGLNERIFIWGNEPTVYALSERSPVGKFTTTFHIESLAAFDETARAIGKIKPDIIIVMAYEKTKFTELQAILANQYVWIKNINQALIYKRLI